MPKAQRTTALARNCIASAMPPATAWHALIETSFDAGVQKPPGYCWSTPFNVLGVLFLEEVYSAFLPSKKACWTHIFRHLGVGQQYPLVFCMTLHATSSSAHKVGSIPNSCIAYKAPATFCAECSCARGTFCVKPLEVVLREARS